MIIFLLILCIFLFISTTLLAVLLTSTMIYFGVTSIDNKIINKQDLHNIINNCSTRFTKKKKLIRQASHPKISRAKVHKRTYY